MRPRFIAVLVFLATFLAFLVLHWPLLRLPYFWDEAGYYIPAALDFCHSGRLIPQSTLPVGHTPLVMIYLGLVWRLCGYSAAVTRAAMTLVATAMIAALYRLGRRIASREVAVWSAALLALSPLFYAQSTLVHLDLAVALFTTLAIYFLLEGRLWLFALSASLAILSKETGVVLLPVAWLYAWSRQRGSRQEEAPPPLHARIALGTPLVVLAAWALYYHHATGYWTGNRDYLSYNLYSTLSPMRIIWSLLRRAYELFIGGFNWLLSASALAAIWWKRKDAQTDSTDATEGLSWPPFIVLSARLVAIYLLLLSATGGAVLPRYLLPVIPLFYLAAVALVWRLPRFPARLICVAMATCFVWAWFINPPYPYPFEDNLGYADFVRLHEEAARYLEAQPGQPRILTAWPATDELERPVLGYVRRPLRVVAVHGFAPEDLAKAPPESFDLVYFYSRKWEPPGNWVRRFPAWLRLQARYFDYRPQMATYDLAATYHLRLRAEFKRRGQWAQIYSR